MVQFETFGCIESDTGAKSVASPLLVHNSQCFHRLKMNISAAAIQSRQQTLLIMHAHAARIMLQNMQSQTAINRNQLQLAFDCELSSTVLTFHGRKSTVAQSFCWKILVATRFLAVCTKCPYRSFGTYMFRLAPLQCSCERVKDLNQLKVVTPISGLKSTTHL